MAELVFPGTVKIDAEHLESRAELATERIARYRAQLETMNGLIKNTSGYWEGEGRKPTGKPSRNVSGRWRTPFICLKNTLRN